jgi:cytochrome c biogenesis protein CcmG/thiol:disulfide interchange protein DsbE
MIRYLIPLTVFVVLFIILIVGMNVDLKHVSSPYISKPAPAFELPDLLDTSKKISSKDIKGKIVIFNIWASWCGTCYQEHPVLLELAKNKGVLLIGLNYKDSRSAALVMLKKHGNPYHRVAYDMNGTTGIDFGVTAVPETFIIDRDGIVRMKHFGALSYNDLNKKILPLLSKLKNKSDEIQ